MILLYGKPGTGKTTMAVSPATAGLTVLVIDVDNKLSQTKWVQPLVEAGTLLYWPITARLSESRFRDRVLDPIKALTKTPQGYLQFAEMLDSLEEAQASSKEAPADVLVIDSLTAVVEHFKRLAMHLDRPTKRLGTGDIKAPKFEFDHYNTLLVNLEELFHSLKRMEGWFRHVIVTCHEQLEKEQIGEDSIIRDVLPSIEGSMRNRVGRYFEEVYYLRTRQVGREVRYEALTKPFDKTICRTTRSDLPDVIPASLAEVLK